MPKHREPPATPAGNPAAARARWRAVLAGAVLVLAPVAAYHRSLGVPFQFDDEPAVLHNPTIRQLWPPGTALQPPADGAGVTGRPVVNLSLAVNYALDGLNVRGYHAMNLGLHILAVLTLWGVLRRTVERGLRTPPATAERRDSEIPPYRNLSEVWAWSVALLWAVHPLLTETVVGVVQRNEILGGLFYLLTLYGFIRSVEPGARTAWWQMLAVIACLLGMGSKEIVATAPLMVLLYDRTFVAGSFAAAGRARKFFYPALVATWLPLAWLMLGNGQRAGTVGFGLGMSSWAYLLTQCQALTTYLKLAVWPHPLVVDYGAGTCPLGAVWGRGLLLLALLGATGWALRRRLVPGFAGAWFFVILAPSSSFVPLTTQTIAEHRMYLPLIAVLGLLMAGLPRLAGRRTLLVAGLLAVALGAATFRRTEDYRSQQILWADTVAKMPGNPRAQLNLGQALFQAGQVTDAEGCFTEAVRLRPDYPEARYNLGLAESRLGRPAGAIPQFEEAIRLAPDYAVAHDDLGIALAQTGRVAEAQAHFETARRLRPEFAAAHYNLGNLFLRTGRPAEAIPCFEAAIRVRSDLPEYYSSLAAALMQTGRTAEAIGHGETAVRLSPAAAELRLNLALMLAAAGRLHDAIAQAEEAVRLQPDFAAARHYLSTMQADAQHMPPETK